MVDRQKDKFRNRYLLKNGSILLMAALVIFLSWFLGQIVMSCLVNPYLNMMTRDNVYSLTDQRTYVTVDGERVIVYHTEKFGFKPEDIRFISSCVSAGFVAVGVIIALIMLFYKSKSIDAILFDMDEEERRIHFNANNYPNADWRKL